MGPLARPARRPRGPLRRARFPVPSSIGHGLGLFASNPRSEFTRPGWGSGSRRHLVSGFHGFVVSRFREICQRAGRSVAAARRLMQMCMDAGPPAGRSGAPATAAVASARAASIPLSAGAPNHVPPFSRWAHPLYRYRGSARARIGGHRATRRAAHQAPARARLALAHPPRSGASASRHHGRVIDPWHLAAVIEGVRFRMDRAAAIIDRGAIFGAARHALGLRRWFARPDEAQTEAIGCAAATLPATGEGSPLLDAAARRPCLPRPRWRTPATAGGTCALLAAMRVAAPRLPRCSPVQRRWTVRPSGDRGVDRPLPSCVGRGGGAL